MFNKVTKVLFLTFLFFACGRSEDKVTQEDLDKVHNDTRLALLDMTLLFDTKSEESACNYAKKSASTKNIEVIKCSLKNEEYSITVIDSGKSEQEKSFNMAADRSILKESINDIGEIEIKDYFNQIVNAVDYSRKRNAGG